MTLQELERVGYWIAVARPEKNRKGYTEQSSVLLEVLWSDISLSVFLFNESYPRILLQK